MYRTEHALLKVLVRLYFLFFLRPSLMDAICCICACRAKVRILRLLTHRSVVTVQEVFSDSPDYFYMVLERLTGGPVFDRIVKKVCTCGGAKFLDGDISPAYTHSLYGSVVPQ